MIQSNGVKSNIPVTRKATLSTAYDKQRSFTPVPGSSTKLDTNNADPNDINTANHFTKHFTFGQIGYSCDVASIHHTYAEHYRVCDNISNLMAQSPDSDGKFMLCFRELIHS